MCCVSVLLCVSTGVCVSKSGFVRESVRRHGTARHGTVMKKIDHGPTSNFRPSNSGYCTVSHTHMHTCNVN